MSEAMAMAPDPAAEYASRLAQRRAVAQQLARRDVGLSRARLATFGLALAWAWVAIDKHTVPVWSLLIPILGFVALVVAHQRTRQARARAERAVAVYERGVARLEDRWMGTGEFGTRFEDEHHPYSGDLDLFGEGSLFERLCTARTRSGEDALAAWLLSPAPPAVVCARHEAVAELRANLDLREDLGVLGGDVRAALHPDALAAWGRTTPALAPASLIGARLLAFAVALGSAVTLAGWGAGWLGPRPFAALAVVQVVVAALLRPVVRRVIKAVEQPVRELGLLAELLARIEREAFTAPLLREIRTRIDAAGGPPSRRIARLAALIEWLDARRNELFAPVAGLVLWATQFALAVEAWRIRSGPVVGEWLAAVGDIEALCALAGYAYERPQDPFPEFTPGACFVAEALGHPLLPDARCVCNDVHLGEPTRVLVVSGSNMSGKSTLLRTVGVNAVLAFAGAPVHARRLRLSPVRLGASIRLHDSLQAGMSRFYAEITRLRQIVDLAAGAEPVLFLLDEVMHGTNSHDRRIGAEAVVRGLIARGAIGLVTTHDLALARIADDVQGAARNVHFADHLEDGRMVFDYRMQPGVVTKSNALALMRAVGLEV